VVLIGTDTPQVTPAHLEHAAMALETGADAVMGLTPTAGYWLVALRYLHPAAFAGVPMGSDDTGEAPAPASKSAPPKARSPRPGGIDHDWPVNAAPFRLDAHDPFPRDANPGHRAVLDQPCPAAQSRGQQAPGRRGRIGIAGPRLVSCHLVVVDDDPRQQATNLIRIDDLGRDPDSLLHGHVRFEGIPLGRGDQLQEADVVEPGIAADPIGPVCEIGQAPPRETGVGLDVVVHPDHPARPTGGPGGHGRLLEHDRPHPPLGEMEGEARALDPGPDDDDVRRLGHASRC